MFELKYVLNAVVGTFHSYLKMFELNETYSNQLYESLSIDCVVVWGALTVLSPSCLSVHGELFSLHLCSLLDC